MSIETLCQSLCSYHNPQKSEAEKCLAGELVAAWCQKAPHLVPVLAGLLAHSGPIGMRDKARAFLLGQVCSNCVFRRHGCDFAAGVVDAPPCGGFVALANLLVSHTVTTGVITAAWESFRADGYLRLAEHASLRRLESPHVYDRLADELYEVDETGFAWLSRCDGTTPGLAAAADRDFVDYLLAESLLACLATPSPRALPWRQAPVPSLRYLELLLTARCNLRCRHCYQGEAGTEELPLDTVLAILREFHNMQGLRVLLTGGEPLLYRQWSQLNERLPEFELRFVLLTNGLLLSDSLIRQLNVHEVQLSLDGLAHGHDLIRGPGTWRQAVNRLEALLAEGMPVSVATMIHQGNLAELPAMHTWLSGLGIREWNLDIPCKSGRLLQEPDIWVEPLEGAPYLELGFGGSEHGASGEFACGRHLAAVLPNGMVAKCGLYADQPLGHVSEGLETCWLRLSHIPLTELACAPCPHLAVCRGGCRFRAGCGLAPDPVMCALYGVDPTSFEDST